VLQNDKNSYHLVLCLSQSSLQRSNLKIKTDFYGYDGFGVATIAITIGEGD